MTTPIYIAYYLGTKKENSESKLIDRLICWARKIRYSHLELVIDYNEYTGFGTTWSSSPRDGGVRQSIINLKSGHWHVYRIDTDKTVKEIDEFFSRISGCKYDWLGALGVHFRFVKGFRHRWFCSECIGKSLGILDYSQLDPQDIHDHYEFSDSHTQII